MRDPGRDRGSSGRLREVLHHRRLAGGQLFANYAPSFEPPGKAPRPRRDVGWGCADLGRRGRRSDVVGIFPNDAALIRLAGALLVEQNDEWLVGRRYLAESSMGLALEDSMGQDTSLTRSTTTMRRPNSKRPE